MKLTAEVKIESDALWCSGKVRNYGLIKRTKFKKYDYYEQTKMGHKMLIKNTHMRVLTELSIDFLFKAMILILNRTEIMNI